MLRWFAAQRPGVLHLSAVTEAELRRGVAILPEGRRRDAPHAATDGMMVEEFARRIPPFDDRAAVAFAVIFAERRAAGRPIASADRRIAATARA